jgi:hypothetical protein
MSDTRDINGTPYSSAAPNNAPVPSGTLVTVYTSNGPRQGVMVGPVAVPNN